MRVRPRSHTNWSSFVGNALVAALALCTPLAAAAGFVQAASDGWAADASQRMATFWQSLPGSIASAGLIGGLAVALAFAVSPASFGAHSSGSVRKVSLIAGTCLPQIVLVLAGATAAPILGGVAAFWAFHTLAVLPLTSLVLIYSIEQDLRRVIWTGRTQGLDGAQRLTLSTRVIEGRALILLVFAASAAFQNYLLNLCLRARPSEDALVAMAALSPHTGLDWKAVLAACLEIQVVQSLVAAMVAGLLFRQGGSGGTRG